MDGDFEISGEIIMKDWEAVREEIMDEAVSRVRSSGSWEAADGIMVDYMCCLDYEDIYSLQQIRSFYYG